MFPANAITYAYARSQTRSRLSRRRPMRTSCWRSSGPTIRVETAWAYVPLTGIPLLRRGRRSRRRGRGGNRDPGKGGLRIHQWEGIPHLERLRAQPRPARAGAHGGQKPRRRRRARRDRRPQARMVQGGRRSRCASAHAVRAGRRQCQAGAGTLSDGPDEEVWGLDTRFLSDDAAGLAVLDPRKTWELMSYCDGSGQERWVSKYTYEGLMGAFPTAPQRAPQLGDGDRGLHLGTRSSSIPSPIRRRCSRPRLLPASSRYPAAARLSGAAAHGGRKRAGRRRLQAGRDGRRQRRAGAAVTAGEGPGAGAAAEAGLADGEDRRLGATASRSAPPRPARIRPPRRSSPRPTGRRSRRQRSCSTGPPPIRTAARSRATCSTAPTAAAPGTRSRST